METIYPQTLYLAGGLFNAGERLHNLYIEKELKALGYTVLSPQRRALDFFNGDRFKIDEIVLDCQACATHPNTILVACIDGADADSGTCVEYGMAIAANNRAIVYRTDFRTNIANEAGINAMLRGPNTAIIYKPCYFTELNDASWFYHELALEIHLAIQKMLKSD